MKRNCIKILSFILAATMVVGCSKSDDFVPVEFSVATINVDGLPTNASFIPLNSDGPGAEYTPLIGSYLMKRGYDFVGVQENFEYNDLLCAVLDNSYDHDAWGGGVLPSSLQVDLSNWRSYSDGLGGFWKKNHKVTFTERAMWEDGYGRILFGSDRLATKGFRRYEIEIEGQPVVVYNLHMDASTTLSESVGLDNNDRKARLNQWRQLRNHIMERLDDRPVIVLGDMNSYYARDSVKAVFIDAIQATGRAMVGDVWIELNRDGIYPQMEVVPVTADEGVEGNLHQGESLDKILYINPIRGLKLKPVSVSLDTKAYRRPDGKPLGDHFPLAATFRIEK